MFSQLLNIVGSNIPSGGDTFKMLKEDFPKKINSLYLALPEQTVTNLPNFTTPIVTNLRQSPM
jgi:hypothetical protein